MKKIPIIILAIISATVAWITPMGIAEAKNEAKFEVTINVVYNAISADEIADLVENQLRKHKSACKVDIKIKNVDETDLEGGLEGGTWINIDNGSVRTINPFADTSSLYVTD